MTETFLEEFREAAKLVITRGNPHHPPAPQPSPHPAPQPAPHPTPAPQVSWLDGLHDPTLKQDVQAMKGHATEANVDQMLVDLKSELSSAHANLSQSQLHDLQTISSHLQSNESASAYTAYTLNALVAGNSANAEWPKLAGQSPKYLFEQLAAFKSGARKNPLRTPQAAALSEQDMKDLAAHYGAQKPAPGVASKDAVAVAQKLYRAGDAARGLPACAACHGPAGAGNAAAGYPRLGGQHATYNTAALNRLRAAASEPLPDGNLKAMASIAAKLSDAEIAALASYVNGLQ